MRLLCSSLAMQSCYSTPHASLIPAACSRGYIMAWASQGKAAMSNYVVPEVHAAVRVAKSM